MRDPPARRTRPSGVAAPGTLRSTVPRTEPRHKTDPGRIQRSQGTPSTQRPVPVRRPLSRVVRPEEQHGTQAGAKGNSKPRVIRVEDRAKLMQYILRQRSGRTRTVQPSGGRPQQNGRAVQTQGPKRPTSQGKVSRPSSSRGKSAAHKSRSRSGSKSSKKKNH